MNQKRFTVSIDKSDYEALVALGQSVNPPLNLQYLVRLSVRNLLDHYPEQQFTLPFDVRQ
jgi:hypothetical protein